MWQYHSPSWLLAEILDSILTLNVSFIPIILSVFLCLPYFQIISQIWPLLTIGLPSYYKPAVSHLVCDGRLLIGSPDLRLTCYSLHSCQKPKSDHATLCSKFSNDFLAYFWIFQTPYNEPDHLQDELLVSSLIESPTFSPSLSLLWPHYPVFPQVAKHSWLQPLLLLIPLLELSQDIYLHHPLFHFLQVSNSSILQYPFPSLFLFTETITFWL